MKNLFLTLILLSASAVHADNISDLMATGMPAQMASKVDAAYSTGVNADVNITTAGKTLAIQEATAASACSGTLTANGATAVTVSTTCATTGSRIFITRTSAESTAINAYVDNISNGVSFDFTSEAADTGTYNWLIIHEAS